MTLITCFQLGLILGLSSMTVTVHGFVLESPAAACRQDNSGTSSSLRVVEMDLSTKYAASTSLDASATASSAAASSRPVAPVQKIESQMDWMELLWYDEDDEENEDQVTASQFSNEKKQPIVAVSFHASWCRYCLKFQRKWNHKLVRCPLFQDESQIQFATVEYGSNRQLCQSLDIQQLPTVQVYYLGELLTSFPCPPKNFKQLPRALLAYMEMEHDELLAATEAWSRRKAAALLAAKSGSSGSHNSEPTELTEEDNTPSLMEAIGLEDGMEPALYKRKRDRLRTKLKRSNSSSSSSSS